MAQENDTTQQQGQAGPTGDTNAEPAAPQIPDGQNGVPLAPNPESGDTGQPAPGQAPEEIMMPKSRLDELSAKLQEEQQKNALLIQQMQYAQMMAQTPQASQPQGQAGPYDGLEDDDYVSVAVQKQREQQLIAQAREMARQEVQEGLFLSQHPDYAQVVGNANQFTGQFAPSPYLQQALINNPAEQLLLQSLENNRIAQMQRAYDLAKGEYDKQNKSNQPNTNQNVILNSQNTANAQIAPMPAASVGGGGAIPAEAVLSNYSPSEFDEYDRQVAAGKFDKGR